MSYNNDIILIKSEISVNIMDFSAVYKLRWKKKKSGDIICKYSNLLKKNESINNFIPSSHYNNTLITTNEKYD